MKSVKLLACIICSCQFSMIGLAQTSGKVFITDMGSGIFRLAYTTSVPENVSVSVVNNKGETIFKESLHKTSSFSQPYNFSDQPAGDFTVVVEDKQGKTKNTISYAIRTVESTIEVSRIANSPDKYLLAIENNDLDQVQVRILDKDNNSLHDETIIVMGKFAVVYNLSKLKTLPTFEVTGSNGIRKTFRFDAQL
jgi:hypothetical protein